ncbi:hypothetical protein FRB94_014089 [Tulasnella sp. JGI-2019a]|nr:hypothetical protein FRB93_013107 [Tulasnella sp. JGI-2019a]KAG9007667.1 hypothetical protein FRB94_014089 [Tulasnella sp. JGI-2019a]
MSVESLISATDSLSSFDSVVPEAAGMDATVILQPDIKVEDEELPMPSKSLVRSAFCSKLVHFEVEGTLYSISDTLLPGCGYMASAVDQEDPLSGTLEENPMELDITVSEMDNIMSVLHARQLSSPLKLVIEQWSEALHVATIWRLASAREYIIERITKLFPDQPPIDRIALADRCGVQEWLNPAYETICTRADPPTMNEGVERLGFDRIVALFTIREACRGSPPSSAVSPVVSPAVSPYQSAWCHYCNATRQVYSVSPSHYECPHCGGRIPKSTSGLAATISGGIASKMIKDCKGLRWKVAEEDAKAGTPTAPDILSADAPRVVTNKPSSQSSSSTVKKGMKEKKRGKAVSKLANTGQEALR